MAKIINNKPLISIIVPIFNSKLYLDKCINSIISQSYKNLEIILINDGSTDSSFEICKKHAELDKRIKIINKKNGGAAQARNIAINKSKGEYLAFVDSDDYVHVNFIETLFENAKSKNADISACNYYCDYNDGRIVNRPNKPNKKDFDNLQAVRDLLLENSTLETILCNKLFKRKLFMDNNLKLIEGEIYEDTRIMYRLAFYAQKITFINKPLYYYLQRDGSVMNHGVNLNNLNLQTLITKEADTWLKQRTNKLNDEIEAFHLTGQINSLNYMVDGKKIYNNIWRKIAINMRKNRKEYLNNPYISKSRKMLVVLPKFFKTPYKLIRFIYNYNKENNK